MIEKRSVDYRLFGRFKTLIAIVFLIVVIGYGYILSISWKSWAFKDTIDISTYNITISSLGNVLKSFESNSRTISTAEFIPSTNYSLEYRIEVPSLSKNTQELSYIHLGWVAGNPVKVSYNGLETSYIGFDKISLNYTGPGIIIVNTDCYKSAKICGLIGQQPAVIATGNLQNKSIFGLETLVSQFKAILFLLPSLSVGLLLACAWLLGFKGRVLFLSLSVLLLMLGKNLLHLFGDSFFDPLLWRSYTNLTSLLIASWVFCFHLEITKLMRKKIYTIQRVSFAIFVTAISFFNGDQLSQFLEASNISQVTNLVYAVGSASIYLYLSLIQKKKMRTVFTNSILMTGFLGCVLVAERSFFNSSHVLIIFDLFLPMYIGYLALDDIASSEKRYQKTREEKQVISLALDLETEKTASLQRFLPQTIVNQFQDGKSIQENIAKVLKPRMKNVAVIQADMRGFSQYLKTQGPEAVSETLKECFAPVVLLAQEFSYLKLVGDCFFAFIEDTEGERSATDFALEIAHMLVSQVKEVNAKSPNAKIRFGIGVAYGPGLVGNLSSDQCIDYSVVGDTANLAARLEELSKNPTIANTVGENAVIMNGGAVESLRKYKNLTVCELSDVQIRSFENMRQAFYLTESEIRYLTRFQAVRKAG